MVALGLTVTHTVLPAPVYPPVIGYVLHCGPALRVHHQHPADQSTSIYQETAQVQSVSFLIQNAICFVDITCFYSTEFDVADIALGSLNSKGAEMAMVDVGFYS